MNQTKMVSLRLDKSTHKKLLEVAEKEGVSVSLLIRRAVERYLKEEELVRKYDMAEISRKIDEIERKYSKLLRAVNILQRRMEEIQKRGL
ncbi:MAG: hypothetical protein DRN40_06175 [Thermoplasmata archaeon]|nr:MAG: hypothetical protein DRN40_06175 [Thermoplasmata archaeon]